MAGDVEWEPSAPAGSETNASDDILDVGRDRRTPALLKRVIATAWSVPVLVRWATGGLVCAAIVVVLVIGATPAHRPHRVTPEAVGPVGDQDTSMILATASNLGPLDSYIRSNSPGACALVPIGHSPQRAVTEAVRRVLPDYRIDDTGRVLDQDTAMCSLTLRGHDPRGSVLVIQIVAPQPHVAPEAASVKVVANPVDRSSTISKVSAVATPGWSIVIGAVGPTSDQPASEALLRLAQDPALLW